MFVCVCVCVCVCVRVCVCGACVCVWCVCVCVVLQIYIVFTRGALNKAVKKKKKKGKLGKLQERPLHAVYCNKNATYEELLRWADLHTLQNRRL